MSIALEDPTSVYRYYDRRGVLLYVGITRRGVLRNREHNSGKEWWPYVARQDVEHFPDRSSAHAREVHLIRTHRPPFNKQHNRDHDSLRQVYLAFGEAAAENLPQGPLAMFTALGKQLPLTPADACTATRLHLTTLPEHAGLAHRVTIPDRLIYRAPRKLGHVSDRYALGDRIRITIVGRDLLSAPLFFLRLKCGKQSPPQFTAFEVLGVA